MHVFRNRFLLLGLAGLAALSAVRSADPVPVGQFAALQSLIKPSAGEDKWAEIPWQTDLWAARQKAAREGKPLLLWEMDGHPLGCT
jgi:hypothetical protein